VSPDSDAPDGRLSSVVATRIDLSPATRSALKKRGGNLFIWRDGAGMLHARTQRPRASVNFETIPSDDVTLHIASEIPPPKRWLVIYKRLPWPHFEPLYDPIERGDRVSAVVDNINWP